MFAVDMNVVSSDARNGLPCKFLYSDNLVLMTPTMVDLVRHVAEWRVK